MAITLIYHNRPTSDCIEDLTIALFDMTHDGQESYWHAISNGKRIEPADRSGIVDIMNSDMSTSGYVGVGSNSPKLGAKPVLSYSPKFREFALVLDGFFVNGDELRTKYGGTTDGEVAARFIADANDFQKGIENLSEEVSGHFCISVATEKGEGYAARCPIGVRPLVYGKGEKGHALVTASRALEDIDMEKEYDIRPGQIVAIDGSGIHTLKQLESNMHVCSFLWPYYEMIDCSPEGIDVAVVKFNIGSILASKDKGNGLEVDAVGPVPDSGKGFDEGYAHILGCTRSDMLTKYPYAGRSYSRPTEKSRNIIARVKLNVIPSRVRGRRTVLTEDSLRRGTQLIRPRGPIERQKSAGPKETHLRVCSPRNITYCRCAPPDDDAYEDDTLVANRFPDDEAIANYLGVDSVNFIGIEDFVESITREGGLKEEDICLGCYTGDFDFLK